MDESQAERRRYRQRRFNDGTGGESERCLALWFVARSDMTEQRPPPSTNTPVPIDLATLQPPRDVNIFLHLLEHANFERSELQAIRDAAAARLATSTERASLLAARAELIANQRALWKQEVFGANVPTVARFRRYLRALTTQTALTFDDRREIVSAVNYWRRQLKVNLFYQNIPCVLGTTSPSGNEGGFRLRRTGVNASNIYARTSFPSLEVKRSSRGQ